MKTSLKNDSPAQWEVADIFRLHGKNYRRCNTMPPKQHQVMRAIMTCRTGRYGYHIDVCDHCSHREEAYNSCRDRHCPKCQGIARKKWIAKRLEAILPVAHYHVVFTLPHLLQDIISYNRRLIFNLLFSASAETLLVFGRDPKWLGGEIGFYGVLHTWGQTLWRHPHVHYIVPGGGITQDGRWVEPQYPGKFLFPVRALSKVFRGKFIGALKEAYAQGKLVIPEACKGLEEPTSFERYLDRAVDRNWVVYCKPPFSDAEEVVRYMGRYTHRVAISNRRIEAVSAEAVSFRYKDYQRNRRQWRSMQLSPEEFIRRFLWHVLPASFHKIRHYGFLSNGRCKAMVAEIRNLIGDVVSETPAMEDASGFKCPECSQGRLRPMAIFDTLGRMVHSCLSARGISYAFDTS